MEEYLTTDWTDRKYREWFDCEECYNESIKRAKKTIPYMEWLFYSHRRRAKRGLIYYLFYYDDFVKYHRRHL